ncbi:MAG: methionyl-tRNA formyltransferase [Dongiaceae bacterium]
MSRLRLAFMGTPDFAVPALLALTEAGHQLAAVYAQPSREAGRGQQPRPSPVQAAAVARGLPVHTPTTLKTPEEQAVFASLRIDAAVVVAYGLLLPKAILAAPRLGCLNIHASLLPRWRGAAPIQRALMAGDAETGITIMQMDEGLDTGPMLLQERLPIRPEDNFGTLHDRLAAAGARLVLRALDELAAGQAVVRPQPADGATYAAKLTRDDERLDWRRPALDLMRQVRALSPRPGAWFAQDGDRLRVLAAERVSETFEVAPGVVLDDRLTVACGREALRVTRIQRPGKAPLPAADFLRGYRLPRGTLLPLPAEQPG